MQHERNEVVVQGAIGAPIIRLSREGPVFASVPVRICEFPRTEITVTGLGLEAAGIACLRRGNILRAEGRLALDPATGEVYVQAMRVARMVPDGSDMRAIAPSVEELDRLASLIDAPVTAPVV
ncbi:MAG: hypothetical protein DIJKHBIC_02306 [Thermoanaerobaculia bacterium]|nr:hypothetical protein [Thermoanaerobaculia bacterium]